MFDINQSNPGILKNISTDANSRVIFVQDVDKIKFTIVTDASADFDVEVFQSIQELPPDPTISASSTNQYSPVSYQDEGDDVTYTGSIPFNPTAAAVQKTFNVNTTGARWIFFRIAGYVAGTLIDLSEEGMTNTV